MVGTKHSANVLEVDIKDRGLLIETALNYNSSLGWATSPLLVPGPDFVRML